MPPDSDQPLVSVIIPAFNAAAIIERTLRSVTAQTYMALEILVIDDGSTDETASIVSGLAAEDDRIKLLTQENKGVSAARNLGIESSSGQYVAPLDADDTWMPRKIEKQVNVFRTSPATVGVVYTQSVRIFEDGRSPVYSASAAEEGSVFFPLLLGNFLQNASTPLIRRRCFDDVGTYSLAYREANAQGCEDWDIYLRLAEHCEYRVVDEYLTGYWQSTGSMSADWRLMDRSYQLLMEGVKKRHPDIPAYVYRWSKSNYFLYLANRAARANEAAASMRLLVRAVASDPFMLTNHRLQRLVAKNLLSTGRGHKSPASAAPRGEPLDKQGRGGAPSAAGRTIWGSCLKQRTRRLDKLQKELGIAEIPEIDGKDSSPAGGA